ncbi:chitobiase/beta-hexosaminidase C-terminal domain-containing protein [Silvibacterium acidisoli]|uniref:chitobiase/beta-hexosaminidase C-terminal domain-containing protein n=1 Tax=Acidobacteriaceae bacterium ZG23-2 TaxID=2883246 RepID=UPI00406CB0DC
MRVWTKYAQLKYVTIPWLVLLTFVGFTSTLRAQSNATVPTNIAIGSTVVQPSVTRLGINLGDQDNYDSGQMMKNLVFTNPGFEPMRYRSILQCIVVAGNTCLDANTYNPQPAGFWTGASYYVMSGAQAGTTGTVKTSTTNGSQITVQFDKSLGLAINDYVLVTRAFTNDATDGWATSGTGATFTSDTTDLSPETPGKQALSVSAIGANANGQLTSYFDSTAGHAFVNMKGNFAITFRAKGLGGTNQVTVNALRLTNEAAFVAKTVQLTNSWADYTVNFTANENGSQIGTLELSFVLNNSGMLIDDVSMQQTDGESSNVTAFRDPVVDALTTLQPGTLRMNTTAAIGADLYDEITPAFGRYREGAFTNANEIDQIPYGIPEFLTLCKQVGADPFITIPLATSPQEIADFIDYLTGSGSTTYSAMRVAQGQTAPWTDVFKTIHIELGNETWNGVFLGENMAAPQYGAWANQVFGAARKAAGFDPSKFDLVVGGWSAVPYYTGEVLAASTEHDSIDIAPYLAGTVNSLSTNSMFQGLFAEPEFMDTPGGTSYENYTTATQSITSASGTAKPTKLAIYEENMGTVGGTLTQTQMNQFEPSLGAGVALADHMLQQMRLGVTVQNTYELPGYIYYASNGESTQLFGMVVDMNGVTDLRRPTFIGQALANTAIQGQMVQTAQTGNNPTWAQLPNFDDLLAMTAHYIQSFAFVNGTSHSAVLFNLSPTTALPVILSGANAPNGTVNVSVLNSTNITDSNETSNVVGVKTSTATITPTTTYTLPAHSMTVLTWTGSGSTGSGSTGSGSGSTGSGSGSTGSGSGSTGSGSGSTGTGSGSTGSSGSGGTPPQAKAPTLSLASGTYPTGQTVSIATATPNATIYYTTNGATPTAASSVYTKPLTLAVSTTIKAIGTATGYTPSAVTTATYTIQSQNINFANFANSTGKLDLNGTAKVSGSALVLTDGGYHEAASAWYSAPANVQSFTNDFTFQQVNPNANGLTFTLQNQGPNAVGLFGSGMGYQGINKSVAIKFDLFNAGGEGTNSVGVYTNGALPTVPSVNVPTNQINLHSGHIMSVHMVYNSGKLAMTITDTVTKTTFSTTFSVNIPSVVGANTALVGFTGGTGGASATQSILSWSFTGGSGAPAAAAPVFSVGGGTYTAPQIVALTDSTPGATVYYTTNGTTPTASSTKYTKVFTVSSSQTVQAIAVASGYTNSSVSTVNYVVNNTSSTGTTTNAAINFASGFASSASSVVINGNTERAGTKLMLTNGGPNQQGTAWYSKPVSVKSFVTDFTFQLTNADADGFTFAIQNQGPTAVGIFGEGLGYQFLDKSVAVKFDLFNNSGEGSDSTGVYTDGALPSTPSVNLSTSGIDLHSGHTMHAHIVYNGTTLTLTLTDTSTNASATASFNINIPSVVGNSTAYVGFTGGTGGASAIQDILAWTYTN